jgi:hypothetical protein
VSGHPKRSARPQGHQIRLAQRVKTEGVVYITGRETDSSAPTCGARRRAHGALLPAPLRCAFFLGGGLCSAPALGALLVRRQQALRTAAPCTRSAHSLVACSFSKITCARPRRGAFSLREHQSTLRREQSPSCRPHFDTYTLSAVEHRAPEKPGAGRESRRRY